MTPLSPVSWWAVKGTDRESWPSSRPAWLCLCWLSCFSGNSLGTRARERADCDVLWLRGGAVGEKTGCGQAKKSIAGRQRGENRVKILHKTPHSSSFFLVLSSPTPLSSPWQGKGAIGREGTPFPVQRLRACLWAGSNWTLQAALLSFCLLWHLV